MKYGKTGDSRWDEWLAQYDKYLNKENGGKLPNPDINPDKKPDNYSQGDLMSMMYKYMQTGTTGDKYLDGLIENYMLCGTTGDKDWDAFLEPYKQYLFPNPNGGGGNGGIGGIGGNYNYTFTVSLKYKDALKDAELDRKGLDKDGKIEKLEGID